MDTLGSGVKRGWKPDDRIMALLCGGGYAEYVAVPEELLIPIPPNLTHSQAAAIPEAWLTAFQLLVFIGTATMFVIYNNIFILLHHYNPYICFLGGNNTLLYHHLIIYNPCLCVFLFSIVFILLELCFFYFMHEALCIFVLIISINIKNS